MSQDSFKLQKELEFIKESFNSGIITRNEYGKAKERIENKLEEAKRQEEEDKPEERKKQEEISERRDESKKEPEKRSADYKAAYDREPEKAEEKKSVKADDEIKDRERPLRLETYGDKFSLPKKSALIIGGAIILLIITFLLSLNPDNPMEKNGKSFVCETDLDCYRPGFFGECINAATEEAECAFTEATPLNITVISSEECVICDTDRMKNTLKQIYPGSDFVMKERGEAEDLVDRLDIDVLPAYVFDNSIEKTERFESTEAALVKAGDDYKMKAGASGSSYFFRNDEIKENIALFIDPFSFSSQAAFDNLFSLLGRHEADADIRLFTRKDTESENDEINELLRQACIKKQSKDKFMSYMECIFEKGVTGEACSICLIEEDIPIDETEKCAEEEGLLLLRRDLQAAEKFSINTVPTFIFNNQYKKGGSLSVGILEDIYCKLNDC
ncbi:hypothetical protein GF323_06490 [Candidatus Woesearchaeota archaeon]|nr:hypothetical protein [Candidatus Woesearchaeota archaeon]